MEKIESFKVNHLNLKSGLYLSRRDTDGVSVVSTFDLRFTMPNREEAMGVKAMHTIEHLGATFLRNSNEKDKIIYFGPMGCRTGFYLVMFGELESIDVFDLVVDCMQFICNYSGDIPGATAKECGNYLDQDLVKAKEYAKKYLIRLVNEQNTVYPQ